MAPRGLMSQICSGPPDLRGGDDQGSRREASLDIPPAMSAHVAAPPARRFGAGYPHTQHEPILESWFTSAWSSIASPVALRSLRRFGKAPLLRLPFGFENHSP